MINCLKNVVQIVEGFALQGYLPAEAGLLYAKSHGYHYWYIDGSIHSEFPEHWNEARIKNLLHRCEQNQIQPIFHGNFKVPLASDVESLRKAAVCYVKQEIDICAQLNCPMIIHGGAVVEPRKIRLAHQLALTGLIKSLQILQAYAKDRGVDLWFENLPYYPNYRPFMYVGNQADDIAYILEQLDIALFFDFGHANVNAQLPAIEFFKLFHSHIVGVSMSNNNGSLDQHLGLQDGSLNYGHIVKTMLETHWRGLVAFEVRNASPKQIIFQLASIINEVQTGAKMIAG